ncbi:hypothetical protein [Bacillus toyonensis]|uniref:hypothetical protein n=1 Tax=Bacillus toyonensis TaxID=155322 RepID=UPI000BF1D3AD|nr:hypothetical protein [Bacillus toyonensis]PEL24360.1 hypothetical protein CN624_18410 [Bacillus toyonensis]
MAKNVRQNVEELLQHYPEARENDKLLLLLYWQKVDMVRFSNGDISVIDFLFKATPSESITRARRKVQEEREDLAATDKVKQIRKEREKDMKKILKLGEVI